MDLFIGTSGFAYKEWVGSFYPETLPRTEMLRYYANHFRAVEINNTFFRMPVESALRAWADEVPEGFRFVLKAPQTITHRKRLKEVEEPVANFLASGVLKLGPKLGGNCHRNGPRFSLRLNNPDAKKLASGISTSRRRLI